MALPRLQVAIVTHLRDMNRLSAEKASEIIESPGEMSGEAMEKTLREECGVTEFQLLLAKSRAFGINPFIANNFVPDERTFEKLDRDFCVENEVLPVGLAGDFIVVAMTNPFNLQVTNKIQEETRRKVSVLLALDADVKAGLESEEQNETMAEGFGDVVEALDMEFRVDETELEDGAGDGEESAPIIQLANKIIEDAYYSGGSDVHIEPFEKECRVRVRIDGVCQEKLALPPKAARALLARIKVMSNLDIAESRLPQDGRIVFKQFTKKPINIDLRVSTVPLNHGEGAVMRILDKQKSTLPLQALGFEEDNLEKYRAVINRPYGMVLHCGPTGSGKSMTLYSALNEINSPEICIRTAEDPIEYTLPGLCQVQMQRKIGLTFASALRSFLRQDPDVILVGEIRDKETATIAVEAALTGHLLFSTLHTNDAPGTIARMTEMEIEPFMISASLLCVCAQRLMRRACKVCKQPVELEGREADIMRKAIGHAGTVVKASPSGCPSCNGTGYKGRIGIHEMMTTSEELIDAINKGEETAHIKRIAMMSGMLTLHQDSMRKVSAGISSMQEAIATVPPDLEDLEAIKEEFALEADIRRKADEERRGKFATLRREQTEREAGEREAAAAAASNGGSPGNGTAQ